MTHFPDLPELPDPAAPFKQMARVITQLSEGIRAADQAGQEMTHAAKSGKEAVDRLMQRPVEL